MADRSPRAKHNLPPERLNRNVPQQGQLAPSPRGSRPASQPGPHPPRPARPAAPAKAQSKQKARLEYGQEWLRLAMKVLGITIVVLFIFNFIFGFVRLDNHAMQPAIKAGDLVAFFRLDKTYMPGDLCVIKRDGKLEILRVLARSGDKVDISEQGVIVNGSVVLEPDIKGITRQFEEGIAFPVTLQEGEIFVLGDNRPRATDSRIFGPIKEQDTLGTVMLVMRRRDF